jgi:hypothetical protein
MFAHRVERQREHVRDPTRNTMSSGALHHVISAVDCVRLRTTLEQHA